MKPSAFGVSHDVRFVHFIRDVRWFFTVYDWRMRKCFTLTNWRSTYRSALPHY